MSKAKFISFFILMFFLTSAYAKGNENEPVVIISSYNPDVRSVSENIDKFAKRFAEYNMKNPLKVENMNCRNLSECMEWKERFYSLVEKYYVDGHKPAALVLFGAEASTTFFSMNDSLIMHTPVIIGMRSNNIVHLPDSSNVNLKTWEPEVHYLNHDFKNYNIVGGTVYDYDIGKNINLLEHLYSNIDTLLFLSDNTLGGVTLRAHFLQSIKGFPKYSVECLDGRKMSFAEVDNTLARIRGNKAIFVGTWRIDITDTYAIANSTYSFGQSNPDLPAFTLSNVGLGHWPIGGCIPHYYAMGEELADVVCEYIKEGKSSGLKLAPIDYVFDYEKLQQFNISESQLPGNSIINNRPKSFFRENIYAILIVISIFMLLTIFIRVQRNEINTRRKLQQTLEERGKQLEIAYEKAERANAMKSEFIANMSHEIRTPLNAIVGFAQILADPDMECSRDEKAEYGSYITSNSHLLLTLISDILQMSELDNNKINLNIERVNLAEACVLAASSARTDLIPSVEIKLEVPNEPMIINTDKQRIVEVLGNLLVNAKKFTTEGSITISLQDEDDKYVSISVKDTGTGIPEEEAEHIFERFAKLNAFKQGTGLGLSICKNLIELLGGKIWVDTTYKKGACFKFTIPKI